MRGATIGIVLFGFFLGGCDSCTTRPHPSDAAPEREDAGVAAIHCTPECTLADGTCDPALSGHMCAATRKPAAYFIAATKTLRIFNPALTSRIQAKLHAEILPSRQWRFELRGTTYLADVMTGTVDGGGFIELEDGGRVIVPTHPDDDAGHEWVPGTTAKVGDFQIFDGYRCESQQLPLDCRQAMLPNGTITYIKYVGAGNPVYWGNCSIEAADMCVAYHTDVGTFGTFSDKGCTSQTGKFDEFFFVCLEI